MASERIAYGIVTRPILVQTRSASLGGRNSATITTRLPIETITALALDAKRKRTTPSAIVRRALNVVQALSNASEDPEKALGAVAVALGLPKDAEPEQVRAAFDALIASLPAPPPDPSAEVGDAPPPPPNAKPAKAPPPPPPVTLSRFTDAERAGARKLGITPAEFKARKQSAVVNHSVRKR